MGTRLERRQVVLLKVNAAEGIEETLNPANDAISVEKASISFNPRTEESGERTQSLDAAPDIIGGMEVELTFDYRLRGSGTAATPPEVGDALRCSGYAEIITGAAIPVAAEAAAAGGTAVLANLGASAPATAGALQGMPILFTGAVVGTSFIALYTAAKAATLTDTMPAAIDATSNYQVPPNVLYAPASVAIPDCTIWFYEDGVRTRLTGCRGIANFTHTAGGSGLINFTFRGILVTDRDDQAVPSVTLDSTVKPIWRGAALTLQQVKVGANQLQLQGGGNLVTPPNPNQAEGFDVAEIVSRKMTGSLDPKAELTATRDAIKLMRAGTGQIIHARYGDVAGNRIGITIPDARIKGANPAARDGIVTDDIQFDAAGQDNGHFICFY